MDEAKLSSLQAKSIEARIEFAKIEFPNIAAQDVHNLLLQQMHEQGFPQNTSLESKVDDNDKLQITCDHIHHHCAFLIGSQSLLAVKKNVVSESEIGREFVTLVANFFRCLPGTDQVPVVSNYDHSVEYSVQVVDGFKRGKNKEVLKRFCTLGDLAESRILRGRVTLSYVSAAKDRNYWLKIDAPFNDNEAHLNLELSVQRYPPELFLPGDEQSASKENIWKEAVDLPWSMRLITENLYPVIEKAAAQAEANLEPRS